jgi:hypothetical protein
MRRESSPLLLLVRVGTARKGGHCYCWSCGGGEEKEFRREEREGEVVQPPREVVGCLVVMYVIVGETVLRVVAAEGAAEKEKEEKDENRGERLIFYQLYTRFSSPSEHEICSYL